MRALTVNGVAIDDTFAEAFDMRATAIVITAPTMRWATQAATTMALGAVQFSRQQSAP